MSTPESGQQAQASLTSLPRVENLPRMRGGGYDPDAVRDAFDAFRRHAVQLQAQLRVLQAAGRAGNVEPTGHAVRMDALHLIRAAAEFADVLERDAQAASAAQISRAEQELRKRQRELQAREAEIDRYRADAERQSNELLNAARNESRELTAAAERDAAAELREAEARGARLIEQARHQATELTNAARAEVEKTLDWARSHAAAVIARAQQAAEELLGAAGLGSEALGEVSAAIVAAANATTDAEASWAREPRRPGPRMPEPRLAEAPPPAPRESGEAAEPDEQERSDGDEPA